MPSNSINDDCAEPILNYINKDLAKSTMEKSLFQEMPSNSINHVLTKAKRTSDPIEFYKQWSPENNKYKTSLFSRNAIKFCQQRSRQNKKKFCFQVKPSIKPLNHVRAPIPACSFFSNDAIQFYPQRSRENNECKNICFSILKRRIF